MMSGSCSDVFSRILIIGARLFFTRWDSMQVNLLLLFIADFYSILHSFLYTYIEPSYFLFSIEMFPVLMCVPRTAGFIAHWQESLDDPEYKIFRYLLPFFLPFLIFTNGFTNLQRPRQIYIGENHRDYPDSAGMRDSVSSAASGPALDKPTSRSLPDAAKRRMSRGCYIGNGKKNVEEKRNLLNSVNSKMML